MYPTSRGAGEQGSRGAGERIDSNSLISLYTRIFLQKRDAPRFTWNWALEICNAALPTGKCCPSAIDLHNRLAAKAPIGRVLVLQSPQRFGSISGAEYPERFPKMG